MTKKCQRFSNEIFGVIESRKSLREWILLTLRNYLHLNGLLIIYELHSRLQDNIIPMTLGFYSNFANPFLRLLKKSAQIEIKASIARYFKLVDPISTFSLVLFHCSNPFLMSIFPIFQPTGAVLPKPYPVKGF